MLDKQELCVGKVKHSNRQVRHTSYGKDEDGDILPNKVSMKAPYRKGWGLSPSRYNYSVLKRWLGSQVGNFWADVWSEICRTMTGNNPQVLYAREWLQREVHFPYVGADGKLWVNDSYYGPTTLADACRWNAYYVDPVTGLLCENKVTKKEKLSWREKAKQARLEKCRELDDVTQLHKIDGIWYKVELATVPTAADAPPYWGAYDAVTGSWIYVGNTAWLKDTYYKAGVYGVAKTQLSGKELKAHGLVNSK